MDPKFNKLPRGKITRLVKQAHPMPNLNTCSLPEARAFWNGMLTAATFGITGQLSVRQMEKKAIKELDLLEKSSG